MVQNNVKLYTKEEISNYIKELNASFEDKSKIDEVLSYENTSLLQAYLLNIGVNPKLIEYAAVVESVREHIRDLLTRAKECKITENSITSTLYMNQNPPDVLRAGDNGEILLNNREVINTPNEDGKVIIDKGLSFTSINRFGAVEYDGYKSMVLGDFSAIRRKQIDGQNVVIEESTDSATYGYTNEMEDFGHPLDPTNQEKDFKYNYELFSGLYPRIQNWYKYYFPIYDRTVEEHSDMLKERMLKREIDSLEKEIRFYQTQFVLAGENVIKRTFEVGKMIGFIKAVKDKSPLGKKVAEKILNKVKTLEKPAKDEEVIDEAIPESETDAEKKVRLQKNLEILKRKVSLVHDKNDYLTKAITTIEDELTRIPVIGGIANKATKRYRGKRYEIDELEEIK